MHEKETIQEYSRDIEFNVLIPAYLKIFNDPFAVTLRKYLEYGAKVCDLTPNEYLIEMLKKAVNRNIMGISKKRMNQQ